VEIETLTQNIIQLRKQLSWFGEVSYNIVVMTRSSRVEVGDIGKSVPELGHWSEKYS
jgi:hypothetical protein